MGEVAAIPVLYGMCFMKKCQKVMEKIQGIVIYNILVPNLYKVVVVEKFLTQ